MSDHWQQLFPTAKITPFASTMTDHVSVQITNETWLHIPYTDINRREYALLQALQDTKATNHAQPLTKWQAYLTEQHAIAPVDLERLQFIFIHVTPLAQNEFAKAEWLTVMKSLFQNFVDCFLSDDLYIFILNSSVTFHDFDELEQTLSMIEDDFALKMRLFIGHIWSMKESAIPLLFKVEQDLFKRYLALSNKRTLNYFSDLLLWALPDGVFQAKTIFQTIQQQINQHEGAKQMVEALWLEQATLTKAAQRLFVHRNTLQYRLDRFKETTGFSLKQMNDLTICSIALQQCN